MPNNLFCRSNKGCVVTTAALVQDQTRDMLRQMCLPLIPERRVKGALSTVSRDTGLPFSKLRRIYYGITDHILAWEERAIAFSFERWIEDQERVHAREIENLRALREARINRGRQYEIGFPRDSRGARQGEDRSADVD